MPASVRPICPKPSSTSSIRSGWITPPPAMRESWNAAWIRRCASAACRASTTTEMLSSELPCAIATTLIRLPRVRRTPPPPRRACRACPSPTTATVAIPEPSSTPSISPRAISPPNSRSRLSRASAASASGTLKQIECSEDAWEMSDTEIRRAWSEAKVRAAMPGTPSIPLPVTVTSACPPAAVSALTGKRAGATRSETSVPGASGSPKGRTCSGMRRPATGMSVRGCSTFAP